MDYQTILNTLTTTEHTISSYNGKVGCTCGCLGTHRDTPRARTIALNKIKSSSSDTVDSIFFNDYKNYSIEEKSSITIYHKNNDRQTIIYLNQEGTDIAKQAFEDIEPLWSESWQKPSNTKMIRL